jgi:hypothetical protein
MKNTQTAIVRSISKETFDSAIQTGQNLQKSNQYGSEQHRKGFEMYEACIRFFGEDKLGDTTPSERFRVLLWLQTKS